MAKTYRLHTDLDGAIPDGFIWYENYPTALLTTKSGGNREIKLLLPYDLLRTHPWYSASLTGFIQHRGIISHFAFSTIVKAWQMLAWGREKDEKVLQDAEELLELNNTTGYDDDPFLLNRGVFDFAVTYEQLRITRHSVFKGDERNLNDTQTYVSLDLDELKGLFKNKSIPWFYVLKPLSGTGLFHKTGKSSIGPSRVTETGSGGWGKHDLVDVETSSLLIKGKWAVSSPDIGNLIKRVELVDGKLVVTKSWVFARGQSDNGTGVNLAMSSLWSGCYLLCDLLKQASIMTLRKCPAKKAEELYFDPNACYIHEGDLSVKDAISPAILATQIDSDKQTLFALSDPIKAIFKDREPVADVIERLERETGLPRKPLVQVYYKYKSDERKSQIIYPDMLVECGLGRKAINPRYASYWKASAHLLDESGEINFTGE